MISTTYHPVGSGSCCCETLGPYRQAQENPARRSVMQGTSATQYIVGANVSRQLSPRVKRVVTEILGLKEGILGNKALLIQGQDRNKVVGGGPRRRDKRLTTEVRLIMCRGGVVKDGWMEFEGPSVKPRRDQVQRGRVLSSAGGKALGQERKETEAVTTVALTHLT